jgi:hypothetical protein
MKCYAYNEIRDLVKTGDRLEFAGSSFLSKTIRFFTKQSVNHTALALSIDNWSKYPGNRKFVLEAEPEGVVLRPLSLDLQVKGTICYWTPLATATTANRDAMANYALQMLGKKYDFGSLFLNALGPVHSDARKFFCSELYFMSLVAGGLLLGHYLADNGDVVDEKGKKINSPRPGEFGKFPIFGETALLVM